MSGKTFTFPNSHESYTLLSKNCAERMEYDNAVNYAYKALSLGADKKETICFIARMLTESENPFEAIRLIYSEFPNSDERPTEALYALRDALLTVHEYMSAHKVEIQIVEKDGKLEPADISNSVEEVLSVFELALNDTVAYGCDDSSLTDLWCDMRPIMCICAVHNAFLHMADGRFARTVYELGEPIEHSVSEEELSVAEGMVIANAGLFLNSCLLNGNTDYFLNCMDSLEGLEELAPTTLSVSSAVVLIAKLTGGEKLSFDVLKDDPDSPREELLSVGLAFICAGEKKRAYEYMKRLREFAPYNVGVNRLYAQAAHAVGETRESYAAYDRITKLLPWDASSVKYKSVVLSEKDAEDGERTLLPISAYDKESAAKLVMDEMSDMLNKSMKKIEDGLSGDVQKVLVSFMPALKKNVQLMLIKEFCTSENEQMWDVLRRLLLDADTEREAKAMILKAMRKRQKKQRIAICVNGNFCESYPYMQTGFHMPAPFYEEYKKCYNTAERSYSSLCSLCVNHYYEYFQHSVLSVPMSEEENLPKEFAAMVLSMAVHFCGYDDDTDEILNRHYPELDIEDVDAAVEMCDMNERGFLYDFYSNL